METIFNLDDLFGSDTEAQNEVVEAPEEVKEDDNFDDFLYNMVFGEEE